jgi:hypothetical protein
VAVKAPPEFVQESSHTVLIHAKLIERGFVEVLLHPFFDRLNDPVGFNGQFLRPKLTGERHPDREQQNPRGIPERGNPGKVWQPEGHAPSSV